MKHRNICLTLNNWTEEEYDALRACECKYIVLGKEVGENDTPHIQGYIEFRSPRNFTAIKKQFPRIHIEERMGTAQQAAEYCKKEGDFWENGVLSKQGGRKDIELVKEAVIKGENMRIITMEATSYQAIRTAEILLKYHERQRDFAPHVVWLWGPTGCGKTRTALEELGEDVWISDKTLKWWEGYDAHENVLIDEFRKDFCTFHELLRILDRTPYRVEYKGGSRQLLAKKIYITSCYSPEQVYDTREDIGQLLRRVSEVRFLGSEVLDQKSGGNTSPLPTDNILGEETSDLELI